MIHFANYVYAFNLTINPQQPALIRHCRISGPTLLLTYPLIWYFCAEAGEATNKEAATDEASQEEFVMEYEDGAEEGSFEDDYEFIGLDKAGSPETWPRMELWHGVWNFPLTVCFCFC